MRLIFFTITFFTIFFSQEIFAQKNIEHLIDTTNKILTVNPSEAQKKARAIIYYSKKNNKDKIYARGLELLGKAKYYLSEYDSAIFFLQKADSLFIVLGNQTKNAEILEKIGSCYYSGKAEYDKAMKYYLKSFDIRDKIQDTLGIAYLLNNIANIYYKQNLRDKARQTYKQALLYAKHTKDKKIYSIILNNLGAEYAYIKEYDTALFYYFKALELKKQLDNPISLAVTYGSIGSIYKSMGKLSEAEKYYQTALKILRTKNKYYYAVILNKLADIYIKENKYTQAIDTLNQALQIANQINVLLIKEKAYKKLAHIYELKHDYKKAYKFLLIYTNIHDTLFNQQRDKVINELRLKYETDKQLKENELLKKKNEIKELQITKQRIKLRLAIALVFVFFTLTLLFLVRYRYKQKFAKLLELKNEELAEINRKLIESEQKLKKEIQTKNKFFSIIGHDIRNPLSALPLVTENLENNFEQLPEDKKKYYISSINKTIQNLLYLVENLLTWAKAQSGRFQINKSEFNLHQLVQENINLFMLEIQKKELNVVNNIPKDIIVNSDINIINTVIRNLLSNAIKFTPIGGSIIFDIKSDNDKYIVSIRDTGIGISKQDIKKLFRIDVDAKKIGNSSEKGTGLGLIIIKEFLNILGEDINVESTEGQGSVFSFTIKK